MKVRTYNMAELCEAIEKAHGKIVEAFRLEYPTDPRCAWSLRINVKCENWDMSWAPAEKEENVKELLGRDDIVGFEWRRYSDKILQIVTREE